MVDRVEENPVRIGSFVRPRSRHLCRVTEREIYGISFYGLTCEIVEPTSDDEETVADEGLTNYYELAITSGHKMKRR